MTTLCPKILGYLENNTYICERIVLFYYYVLIDSSAMKTDQLKVLRNKRTLNLWDRVEKMFVKIQFNKDCSFVCWQRYVSKDRLNWVCWNEFLNLKEVDRILNRRSSSVKN